MDWHQTAQSFKETVGNVRDAVIVLPEKIVDISDTCYDTIHKSVQKKKVTFHVPYEPDASEQERMFRLIEEARRQEVQGWLAKNNFPDARSVVPVVKSSYQNAKSKPTPVTVELTPSLKALEDRNLRMLRLLLSHSDQKTLHTTLRTALREHDAEDFVQILLNFLQNQQKTSASENKTTVFAGLEDERLHALARQFLRENNFESVFASRERRRIFRSKEILTPMRIAVRQGCLDTIEALVYAGAPQCQDHSDNPDVTRLLKITNPPSERQVKRGSTRSAGSPIEEVPSTVWL